jgi:hypothetical protein
MSQPGFEPPTSCTAGGHSSIELARHLTHQLRFTMMISYSLAALLKRLFQIQTCVLVWSNNVHTIKFNDLTLFDLKVHKNENFFGFDFECCTISLLVMHK